MKKLPNREGVIALITLLILLGVGALGIAMVITSQLNTTAANNYRYKIQTNCAADGMITLLAQDVLDFNEGKYFTGSYTLATNSDVGTGGDPQTGGSYAYDTVNSVYTIKGGGSDIQGTADHFRFAYMKFSGDIDVTVNVSSITAADPWSKAGIMIRQDLTAGSKNVYCCLTPTTGNKGNIQYRNTVSGGTTYKQVGTFTAPQYLRLTRAGTIYSARYSPDGTAWNLIGNDTVSMTDSCYIGLAVTSHTTSGICTAVFKNLTGLPTQTHTDSLKIGADSTPVQYTITRLGMDIFSMSADAYKKTGSTSRHNYETHLTQNLSRERIGTWHSISKDTACIPVTLYDMRADMSNPEFNVNGIYLNSSWVYQSAHFIRTDSMTNDRKPLKKAPVAAFRTCFMNLWDANWYTTTSKAVRAAKANSWPPPSSAEGTCVSTYDPTWGWDFNDSMHTWFRPWGGDTTGIKYDYNTNKYTGLVMRPGWTPHYPGEDTEWVAPNWDSTNPFANIVMYDTLTFNEKYAPDTGVFRFGDTVYNPKWFFKFTSCPCCNTAYRFMPLKNRGFGWDCSARYPLDSLKAHNCDTVTWKKQNFSFTMEVHRTFTYKSGQTFAFIGDDDVFVFINNKCVINIGGIHDQLGASVNLDTIHPSLAEGVEYPFDFFYTERCVTESHILITTNLLFFIPPQPLKRSWKRDYGNLD